MAPPTKSSNQAIRSNSPRPQRSLTESLELALAVNVLEPEPLAMVPPAGGPTGPMWGSPDLAPGDAALRVGLSFAHTAQGHRQVPYSSRNAGSTYHGPTCAAGEGADGHQAGHHHLLRHDPHLFLLAVHPNLLEEPPSGGQWAGKGEGADPAAEL